MPPDWAYNNSTLYPRESPQLGSWGFDYAQLFTSEFAELMGIDTEWIYVLVFGLGWGLVGIATVVFSSCALLLAILLTFID